VSTPEANTTVSKTASPKGSLSILMPAEADTETGRRAAEHIVDLVKGEVPR
jgi:hypothetical protein